MANISENIANAIVLNGNNNVRNMPIFAGDVLHIVVPETPEAAAQFIVNNGNWDGILTVEGIQLSVAALCRNGNGLALTADNNQARIVELLGHENNGVVALRVERVNQRQAVNPQNGELQMRNYYIFAWA